MATANRTGLRESSVKWAFGIPNWYIFSENEFRRLSGYLYSNTTLRDALLERYLDCEAFCEGDECFFCSDIAPVFPQCCEKVVELIREH